MTYTIHILKVQKLELNNLNHIKLNDIVPSKVLKILKTFLSRPRPRPRLFSQGQDQDQDSGSQDQDQDLISVLEAPRDQDLGLEDYITALVCVKYAILLVLSF